MHPSPALINAYQTVKVLAAGRYDVWWSGFYNTSTPVGQLRICSYPVNMPYYHFGGKNAPHTPFLLVEVDGRVVARHPHNGHHVEIGDTSEFHDLLRLVSTQ